MMNSIMLHAACRVTAWIVPTCSLESKRTEQHVMLREVDAVIVILVGQLSPLEFPKEFAVLLPYSAAR